METQAQETTVVSKGTATQDMLEDIVAHPEKYGFEWRYIWTPAKGTGKDKVLMRGEVPAPLPFVVNAELFAKSFGGQILIDAFNGTSGRVEAQDVVRSEIEKNRKITDSDLMRAIVRSVLFAIRRAGGGGGNRTVYVDPTTGKQYKSLEDLKAAQAPQKYKDIQGNEHETLRDAQASSINHIMQAVPGMTLEMAKKALGIGS